MLHKQYKLKMAKADLTCVGVSNLLVKKPLDLSKSDSARMAFLTDTRSGHTQKFEEIAREVSPPNMVKLQASCFSVFLYHFFNTTTAESRRTTSEPYTSNDAVSAKTFKGLTDRKFYLGVD
jgi:hypothetical protein